jgi:hypothetical protein
MGIRPHIWSFIVHHWHLFVNGFFFLFPVNFRKIRLLPESVLPSPLPFQRAGFFIFAAKASFPFSFHILPQLQTPLRQKQKAAPPGSGFSSEYSQNSFAR